MELISNADLQTILDAKEQLLEAKARMSKNYRSVFFGGRWITLRLDLSSPTGCNIYFDDENQKVFVKGKKSPINEPNAMRFADAIITLYVYPREAQQILMAVKY
jgi:hypothetical protein